jgi:hypothetical protein
MRRLASFGKAGVERDYGISHNSGGIGEQLRTVRLAAQPRNPERPRC